MIPLFKVKMSDKAGEAVSKVLSSGYIGEGEKVKEFELALQKELSAPSVPLALNSCTSAITLALHLIGVGPGDEVITTSITCTATNSPIITAGATPVFADVDQFTGNIDPSTLGNFITAKTKAIIAVDWTGRFCDYDALQEFGLPIIQDAAHGPFMFDGRTTGDYVCLSFQAIKHLTTGDGGALIINSGAQNSAIRKRARLLRWYGLDRESSADFRCSQNIKEVGYKMHMNDINATIGLANLPDLWVTIYEHRKNARRFCEFMKNLDVAIVPYDPKSAYWVFPVIVANQAKFIEHMTSHGIMASQVHANNAKHDAFPKGTRSAELFDKEQVNIPCGWWLTPGEVDTIIDAVNSYGR